VPYFGAQKLPLPSNKAWLNGRVFIKLLTSAIRRCLAIVRYLSHADTSCNVLWLAFRRHAFCISIGTPAVLPRLSWLSWASPVLPITLTAFFPRPLQFTAHYNPNSTARSQIYRVVQQTNNPFSKSSKPALPSTQPPVRFFSARKPAGR